MANSVITYIFGILTVLVIAAGVYIYIDFTRSETTVANYRLGESRDDTYIYDKGDKVMENAIDQTIKDNLNAAPQAEKAKATVEGVLCYPSNFLPPGEIVAKNTVTDETTMMEVDGQAANFKMYLDAGTYNLRYQAYAGGNLSDDYISGYYTKCAIESTAEVCEAEDGHDLIPITVFVGETKSDVRLCDFYYSEEPAF